MRNKKAKAYRKLLGDVSAEYNKQEFHYINYGSAEKPNFVKTSNPITLKDSCGRARYKILKEIDT